MEKLNRKLILEFLEDEVQDVSVDKLNIETPIQEPIEVKQEEPVPTPKLSEPEKVNFVVSTLTELSQRVLDLFNYLTPLINTDMTSFNLSEQNKDLLNSIYEDVSLVLGKVQQGIKDNCVDNIQNAIDDGQTQAQETITPEVDLTEDLNSDKEKLEESILKEAPDEYGLPTDDELSSEADRIRREYDQKIKDLYSNRDSQRKEIKLREFNEVLNKLNSNPALEELKKQLLNNEILKFNVTDEKSGLMAYSFGDGWITFSSDLPGFKYMNIRLMLNDFKFNNELYENRLGSQIKLLNLINDNLKNIVDLNKEENEGEFKSNLIGSLGNTLKRAIGEKAFSKISKLSNIENGSHWAWGGRFMLFEYEGSLYRFEVYNDQVNVRIDKRTPGLKLRVFNKVENKLGWYENPIIEKLGLEGFKKLFPEAQIFQGYIIC